MPNDNNKSEKLLWIEILRIIASFAVIIIHVVSNSYNPYTNTWLWNVANIYSMSSRWAVPVFLMITGSLMLDPKRNLSIKDIFNKYLIKYLKIYCIWSFIYVVWLYIIFKGINNNFIFTIDYKAMILLFLNGYAHLGYFHYFIAFIIMLPILINIVKLSNRIIFEYFLFLWFIFTSFLPITLNILQITTMSNWLLFNEINLIGGLIGYFFLGYYFLKYDLNKLTRICIYILGISATVFSIIITKVISVKNDNLFTLFHSYKVFTIALTASALFIFFKYELTHILINLHDKIKKFLFIIGECTFGIYLIHNILIDIANYIGMKRIIASHPIRYIFICTFIIFITSLFLVYIYKVIYNKIKTKINIIK